MVVAGGYYCYIGSAESEYPLEGYLAHERLPPPPLGPPQEPRHGPTVGSYCFLYERGTPALAVVVRGVSRKGRRMSVL